MRQRFTVWVVFAAMAAAAFLPGCKTTEANYRAAYERAVAGRDSSQVTLEESIYGANRRMMGARQFVMAGDTFDVRSQRVIVTEDGGGIRENLRTYNVVVGQFKQLFNARSMRERIANGGYPGAFVVETAEPYYYVVLGSYADLDAAARALKAIPEDFPVNMREPLPFILQSGR